VILGLDDFRPEPGELDAIPVPDFTSSGGHSLVPGDVATIYDIVPLYQSGTNGSGQKIAVVGQTDIYLSDIEHFRSEFGLPANNPQLVLVTGSADPGVSADDLIESDLDLEYSGGIAPSATVLFVYSTSVYNSVAFAVDQALAPVITMSYGYCEPQISNDPETTAAYFQSLAQQANSMGITWLASSGDSGAAACDSTSEQVATQGLAVNLPASVPEITAVGGTEFMEGSGTYWSSSNNSNGSSALSYIPETAWNDTALTGNLLAGGGGASILFAKPAWQSGAGVPNDNARDVPDLSFSAAIHDPYQVYSNGETWYVGGTSASSPVFSGVLALLNQYMITSGSQSEPGLGNINPALYLLAGTPGVFHDVTLGNNIVPCAAGSPNCNAGQLGYDAGVGYDQATGLGSADAYKLVTLWNNSAAIPTTTTVGANLNSITKSGSVLLTATVTAASGTASPAGPVSFTLGQTVLGTAQLSGSNGKATASLSVNGSQLAVGANEITATYSGSALFSMSTGSVSVTVAGGTVTAVSVSPSSGSGASQTFALRYSDTAGAADLQTAYVWFNAALANPASSCMLYYQPSTNQLNLLNDAATAWQAGTPGAATTLQNSQCSVNMAGTTVALNGNMLTLNLAMTFKSAYDGAKNVYMYGADVSGSTSGWQQLGTWTAPAASGTPAVVSVSPSSGSGASQTFALQYSDTAGAANLQTAYVWFAATLTNAASSCMLYYQPSTNQLNLLNNAATAWQAGTPGAATTLQNSQCSVNLAGTTVTLNGNTLTLNPAMAFKPAYDGAKNVYMYDADVSGSNSGWQQLGTWTVPAGSGTPAVVSVNPSSGSAISQMFALQYSDTAGAANLQTAYVWFAATLTNVAGSCMFYYQPSTDQLNLLNDGATAWQAGTPGAATTLQNSQCSVNLAGTTVALNGNTLTLNLAMTFKPAYDGAKNVYMYDTDVSGANSGWQQLGTLTVPAGSGTPAVVSVSPNSGSGASQTFALQYSDTAGAANLQTAYVWFTATLTNAASSCMLYYQPSTNQLNLLNDAATAWQAGTPGAATTLQNSQCSVNLAATTVTLNGDTLTLNPAMTFKPAYDGARTVYMYDADISGSNSGWQQLGAWTVP
jgi:Bacterial Ig-like domain (group 3)